MNLKRNVVKLMAPGITALDRTGHSFKLTNKDIRKARPKSTLNFDAIVLRHGESKEVDADLALIYLEKFPQLAIASGKKQSVDNYINEIKDKPANDIKTILKKHNDAAKGMGIETLGFPQKKQDLLENIAILRSKGVVLPEEVQVGLLNDDDPGLEKLRKERDKTLKKEADELVERFEKILEELKGIGMSRSEILVIRGKLIVMPDKQYSAFKKAAGQFLGLEKYEVGNLTKEEYKNMVIFEKFAEVTELTDGDLQYHRSHVEAALKAGAKLREEVLKDFDDLVKSLEQ